MSSYLRGLLVLSLGGCGSVAGGSGSVDAAIDGTSSVDAAPDAAIDAPVVTPRCDVTRSFGAPTVVAGINGTLKDIQAVQADDLTLYLSTDRGGTTDIYRSTRASATAIWQTPTAVAPFATTALETSPYLTADGLTMLYAYAPVGTVNADIYLATRASTSVAFAAGTAVTAVNSTDDDGDVTVTADGGILFFASSRAGTGGYDLYQSIRGSSGYGAPTLVTAINTNVYDAHPRITGDGLRMYYSSMRTDGGALAGTDIWTASRASLAAPFGAPMRVAELSTASNESPTWISSDGCVMLLQTNRAGGMGDQDIWQAIKPL